jgi:hypothetical protein
VDAALVTTDRDGSVTYWSTVAGTRRRVREVDPEGHELTIVRWTGDGRLDQAWIRIPPRGVVGIVARGGRDGRDELRVADTPADTRSARAVGDFAPLDYAAIDEIPVLAEPHRLPAHAGTAVLNVLATLAADAGRDALRYRGPYSSESLFLALLESFHYTPDTDDPLTAFVHGVLRWQPAPHARSFTDEVYVQRRGRVEKVVWHGRAYYRAEWQGITRHAPRRIHDDGQDACCALWALGRPLETHLAIGADGRARAMAPPPPASSRVAPFEAMLRAGVASIVMAQSAPALGRSLQDIVRTMTLEWGPVDEDLVITIPDGLRVSTRLHDAAREAIRVTATRQEHLGLALTLMSDIAALAGDFLRAHAQARLAALGPEEQAAALREKGEAPSAQAIAAAADALVAHLAAPPT